MQMYDIGKKLWTTEGEEQDAAKKEFLDCLGVLEGDLGGKPFSGGGGGGGGPSDSWTWRLFHSTVGF